MTEVTIALPKGRLAEQTVELLEKCGINCSALKSVSRQLVQWDDSKRFKFVLVKPSDVPTYIERGAADIGVAGKDTLLEQRKDVYELVDLKFGKCRMCVAGYRQTGNKITKGTIRVATKYPSIAKDYYESKGLNVDIIKLNGSVELGPIVGLSDVIVDIVESGKTLEANGLTVLEEICTLTARLIVNKISFKTKSELIRPLADKITEVINS